MCVCVCACLGLHNVQNRDLALHNVQHRQRLGCLGQNNWVVCQGKWLGGVCVFYDESQYIIYLLHARNECINKKEKKKIKDLLRYI